jgi:hypothetical protein
MPGGDDPWDRGPSQGREDARPRGRFTAVEWGMRKRSRGRGRLLAVPFVMTTLVGGAAAEASARPTVQNGMPRNPPRTELPPPPADGKVQRRPDGTCWSQPEMKCPPQAKCNPPPPRQVKCPPSQRPSQ